MTAQTTEPGAPQDAGTPPTDDAAEPREGDATTDAGDTDGGDTDAGDLDLDTARALIRKRNSEAANLRRRLRELEPLAREAQERRESEMTEAQRAQARAEAAERERDEARQELTRLRLAARYGLAEDDLDLLGSGSDEALEARAKRLADRLGTAPTGGRRFPRRPTERLIPGGGVARTEDDLSPAELSRLIRNGGSTD